ncbi:hypothetical protein HMPREF1316_0418 [Olsenella profusa F0195]|uniref:Uncharacterized protein n=1 Tax=Olsenella profusa F0195 TaxID=1125712 RepID=U2T6I4_9ACTN|nr:hypothetical protein HMPREF1316_0418 [Olsenella profusa F0195]
MPSTAARPLPVLPRIAPKALPSFDMCGPVRSARGFSRLRHKYGMPDRQ